MKNEFHILKTRKDVLETIFKEVGLEPPLEGEYVTRDEAVQLLEKIVELKGKK